MRVIQMYNLPFRSKNYKKKGIINTCSLAQVGLQTLGIEHPMKIFDDRRF